MALAYLGNGSVVELGRYGRAGGRQWTSPRGGVGARRAGCAAGHVVWLLIRAAIHVGIGRDTDIVDMTVV